MQNAASSLQLGPDLANPPLYSITDETRWMRRVAILTMSLTMLPYFIGWLMGQGRQFMWLGHNLDDSCVYLSWMRQAADGSIRVLNLFTTAPQHGMLLNPLFLALGWCARLTGLPLIAVYHLSRLFFGFCLLMVVWKLLLLTVAKAEARRLAFLCVCFASGLGWLPGLWEAFPTQTPIDKWQPEAITFLSLYLSPLFCFSMVLQVAILTLLFLGEKTKKSRYAFYTGVCGFVLGLVHTYDIISLSAIWVTYLLITYLQSLRKSPDNPDGALFDISSLMRAGIAGILTLPAVAYIYHELKTEAIFNARMNVVTASAEPIWLLAGYGLTLALAVFTVCLHVRNQTSGKKIDESEVDEEKIGDREIHGREITHWLTDQNSWRLLITWAIMNILVSYFPVRLFPFQRKMLQGTHFPIAFLAGIALAWLVTQPAFGKQIKNASLATLLIVFLLALTNIRFVAREITNFRGNVSSTGLQRPYLNPGEIEALQWLQKNTPEGTAIQPLPWVMKTDAHHLGVVDMSMACFAPGLIHRAVYCGHWGETPDFKGKTDDFIHFMYPNMPDDLRRAMLLNMKVKYLVYSQREIQDGTENPFHPFLSDPISVPSYLTKVHSNQDADVYRIDL